MTPPAGRREKSGRRIVGAAGRRSRGSRPPVIDDENRIAVGARFSPRPLRALRTWWEGSTDDDRVVGRDVDVRLPDRVCPRERV